MMMGKAFWTFVAVLLPAVHAEEDPAAPAATTTGGVNNFDVSNFQPV